MITAHQLEVRAGARLLMDDVTFRVAAGDKVGLVGRNGAGKTTLTKILAGEALPAVRLGHRDRRRSATCRRTRAPATPRCSRRDRILSARGLDDVVRRLREAEVEMGSRRPGRSATGRCAATRSADAELHAGGGYAAEAEAAQIASQPRHRGPDPRPAAAHPVRRPAPPRRAGPDPVLRRRDAAARRADQPPRRRLDRLAARLPQGPQGRPDRDQPRRRRCSRPCVNKVLHLDANRGRDRRLQHGLDGLPRPARDRREAPQARADERREQGEDAHRPGQQDARQGHQGPGRAVDAQARREDDGRASRASAAADKVARIKFPAPAPCGKTPLTAAELSKSYGSLEVFTDVDLAIDKGSRVVILGLNGAGKTTLLRILGRRRPARHRRGACPGTASSSATTPRSTRPSTPAAPCWRTCSTPRRS